MKLKAPKYPLRKQLAVAKQELREYDDLFEIQSTRLAKATLLWREKHAKPDTSPDLGTLLDWLMDRGERWQAVLEASRTIVSNKNKRGHWGYWELAAALKRHDQFWGLKP